MYNTRFKAMLEGLGMTYTDFAKMSGHTPESVRSMASSKKHFPRSLKIAVEVYERMNSNPSTNATEAHHTTQEA